MTDALLAICERTVWQNSVQGLVPGPEGNHHPFLCPFGVFPASDGFVTIAAQQNVFFPFLCRQLDAPELGEDPRFRTREDRKANRLALIDEVSALTCRFSKSELIQRLGGNIPFGPVMDIGDIMEDPHFRIRDMLVDVENPGTSPITIAGVPIKMTDTPGRIARRAPLLGEHTREILREAGLTDDQVKAVLAQSVPNLQTY
jgi:crotonobetainyl-CoA:carnitine CoA-transferase CaiB-like acyl-CoA transferase